MKTAPQLQHIITQLLEKHGIAQNDPAAFLWLTCPAHTEQLIIERIDARYLSVALAGATARDAFTLAPQLFLATDTAGWTPIQLDGAEAGGDLPQFAEAWAQRIHAEGWLERGERLPTPLWVGNEEALWASVFDGAADDDGKADPPAGNKEALCNLPW
jgi:hypothetical protein